MKKTFSLYMVSVNQNTVVAFAASLPVSKCNKFVIILLGSGTGWSVGQFVRMPKGPAVRREKVCESMKTFAFLSISTY